VENSRFEITWPVSAFGKIHEGFSSNFKRNILEKRWRFQSLARYSRKDINLGIGANEAKFD